MTKKVVVSLEHRFYIFDGELYTKLAFPYSYWKSYLSYFSEVVIVARALRVHEMDTSFKKVSGEGVTFVPLKYFVGIKSFILSAPKLTGQLMSVARSNEKFLLRSGNISNVLWLWLMVFRRQYIREYPGNIFEGVTGYGGGGSALKLLAFVLDFIAKAQGKFSLANSFVSLYCKKLYESKRPSYVFSSFDLDEISYRKTSYKCADIISLVTVGRLEAEKGHRDLIEGLALINKNIKLTVIGDGTQKKQLQQLSEKLEVNVDFRGAITDRDELFSILKGSDIYVIPSLTEGMPRSLLEAMAVGMPCIGTTVGGIPEVLDKQYLAPSKSPKSLAFLLSRVSESEIKRSHMGAENVQFIEDNYSRSAMDKQKLRFWAELYK